MHKAELRQKRANGKLTKKSLLFGLCNTNGSPLSGLYTCTVEWSVEAPVETQYLVEVLVPPSITSLAARGEVREGDTAEIECQGGQHPPAGNTHDK